MSRRHLLAVLLVAALVALAGCNGGPSETNNSTDPTTPAPGTQAPAVDGDVTPPKLVVLSPSSDSGEAPLRIMFNVMDAESEVDFSTLRVYDESTNTELPTSRNGQNVNATLNGTTGTTHNVVISVRDDEGNLAQTSLSLTLTGQNAQQTPDDGETNTGGENETPTELTADAGGDVTVPPSTEFTLDASGSAAPNSAIEEYRWDFDGDGTYERYWGAPQITHTFGSPGTYNVGLRVVSEDGQMAEDAITVTVSESATDPGQSSAPTANAGADFSVKTGDTAEFNASESSDPDGDINEYSWDFDGDGTFDAAYAQPTVTQTYNQAGRFSVRLKVTDDEGNSDTDTVAVTVSENTPPVADITASPTDTSVGATVRFDASASTDNDGSISEYRWDFNNDGTYDEYTQEPTTSYAYQSGGSYSARVNVVDNEGGMANDVMSISVSSGSGSSGPSEPIAALTGDSTIDKGQSAMLDASGSSDNDNDITQYRWDFDGDGTTDTSTTSPTTSHTYTTAGSYSVRVFVVDSGGRTDSTTHSLTVQGDSMPVANAGSDGTYGVDTSVPFDAAGSSDPDGSIVEYAWDFTNDGTIDERTSNTAMSHTYTEQGTYSARLVVTDDEGNTDEDLRSVTITNNPPNADAGSEKTTRPGETITFEGGESADPDGHVITKYEWDFNDDGTYEESSSGSTASYTFSSSGTYEVTLRVTDEYGETATDTTTVTVESNAQPTADAGSTATVLVGTTYQFDGSGSSDSDGNIVEYQWDFDGDGSIDATDSSAIAEYMYSASGTYQAELGVVDNNGGTGSDTVIIEVTNTDPTVDAGENQIVSAGSSVTFNATASDPDGHAVPTYEWDVDGDNSYEDSYSGPDISTTYDSPGTYTVRVRVTDEYGAQATDTLEVTVE